MVMIEFGEQNLLWIFWYFYERVHVSNVSLDEEACAQCATTHRGGRSSLHREMLLRRESPIYNTYDIPYDDVQILLWLLMVPYLVGARSIILSLLYALIVIVPSRVPGMYIRIMSHEMRADIHLVSCRMVLLLLAYLPLPQPGKPIVGHVKVFYYTE